MPLVYRGYSAHIASEGREVPQYQVDIDNEERIITCWIPSEAGKAFIATFTTIERHDHECFCADLYADGRRLSGVGAEDHGTRSIKYRKVSPTSRQPFIFSEVHLTPDDEPGSAELNPPDRIGTIDLVIWVGVRIAYSGPNIDQPDTADHGIRVSERSKLMGANHVKPGAIERFDSPSFVHSYGRSGEPYAIFRFQHRPAAVLQAMGVMPRSSPGPQPSLSTAQTAGPSNSRRRHESPERETHKRRRVKEEEQDIKPITNDTEELEARQRRLRAEIAAAKAEAAACEARAAALQVQLEETEAAVRRAGKRPVIV